MSPNKGETGVRMREVLARPGLRAFAYAIGLRTNVSSQVIIIYDISKQTEQRARMGKIFARCHLAMAITRRYAWVSFCSKFNWWSMLRSDWLSHY